MCGCHQWGPGQSSHSYFIIRGSRSRCKHSILKISQYLKVSSRLWDVRSQGFVIHSFLFVCSFKGMLVEGPPGHSGPVVSTFCVFLFCYLRAVNNNLATQCTHTHSLTHNLSVCNYLYDITEVPQTVTFSSIPFPHTSSKMSALFWILRDFQAPLVYKVPLDQPEILVTGWVFVLVGIQCTEYRMLVEGRGFFSAHIQDCSGLRRCFFMPIFYVMIF